MSETSLRQRSMGPSSTGKEIKAVFRESKNTDTMPLDTNEKIISEVAGFYSAKEYGLCKIGEMLDHYIPMPRRKITVLLLGNHSAGKSSFINWYIEQTILKTGVAIETQGFAFVTSGKKRDTLKGLATLQLYPHLKPLQDLPGVIDFVTTEISTSRAKKFNLVTFVDTPGLVDGDMHYPYDVNKTLLWLGDMADLVFVFFDPMGQALCKRTLNILEKMWSSHSEKIRLYLAKADEAGLETDRQKVLMQIVQELCKRPGLNRSGFDMPTIFLPDILSTKPTRCANQIDEACTEIAKCIDQTVQNSLNMLEKDSEILENKIENIIVADKAARARNSKRTFRGTGLSCFGVLLPILLFSSILVANSSEDSMSHHFGNATAYIRHFILPMAYVWTYIPPDFHLQFVILIVGVSAACLIISRLDPLEKVLPARELKSFQAAYQVIKETQEEKRTLYSTYLRQSVGDEDYRE